MLTPTTGQDFLQCYRWGMLPDVIWHEARGESFEGMVAVGEVVLNRMLDKRWPDDVEAVALQPWQFSCYNRNDPNSTMRPNPNNRGPWTQFRECCEAAAQAIANVESGQQVTKGANHYLNPKAVVAIPVWYDRKKITTVIENHEFLKL